MPWKERFPDVAEVRERHAEATGVVRRPVGMAGRFSRLEEVFECVWATTWGEDAQILGRFFKFGSTWPSIFIGAGSQLARTGKLPCAAMV